MRIKCNYCGGYLEDTDVKCPNCNAPNEQLKRSADGIPKTIEELKTFATEKGIPLSQMRFFIGYDIREPRAYGIYKDENGKFIVYKNKSNGARSVRYKGSDEAYAVNEIYQKLRTEMAEQKMHQAEKLSQTQPDNNTKWTYQQTKNTTYKSRKNTTSTSLVFIICIIIVCFAVMLGVGSVLFSAVPNSGHHNDNSYFYYDYDYDNDDSYDDYDDDYDDDSYDDWDYDWDDDDWDYDYDWDDSYSDWDSDW